MAWMAAVSWANMRAWVSLGMAIVMMIRMIAITISSSIRENPRRFWRLNIAIPVFYDAASPPGVETKKRCSLIRATNLPEAGPLTGGAGGVAMESGRAR